VDAEYIAQRVGFLWNGVWQVDEAKFRRAIELAKGEQPPAAPGYHKIHSTPQHPIASAIANVAPGVEYMLQSDPDHPGVWLLQLGHTTSSNDALAIVKSVEQHCAAGTRFRVFLQGQEIRYDHRNY